MHKKHGVRLPGYCSCFHKRMKWKGKNLLLSALYNFEYLKYHALKYNESILRILFLFNTCIKIALPKCTDMERHAFLLCKFQSQTLVQHSLLVHFYDPNKTRIDRMWIETIVQETIVAREQLQIKIATFRTPRSCFGFHD